jgi:hypothetical protein
LSSSASRRATGGILRTDVNPHLDGALTGHQQQLVDFDCIITVQLHVAKSIKGFGRAVEFAKTRILARMSFKEDYTAVIGCLTSQECAISHREISCGVGNANGIAISGIEHTAKKDIIAQHGGPIGEEDLAGEGWPIA